MLPRVPTGLLRALQRPLVAASRRPALSRLSSFAVAAVPSSSLVTRPVLLRATAMQTRALSSVGGGSGGDDDGNDDDDEDIKAKKKRDKKKKKDNNNKKKKDEGEDEDSSDDELERRISGADGEAEDDEANDKRGRRGRRGGLSLRVPYSNNDGEPEEVIAANQRPSQDNRGLLGPPVVPKEVSELLVVGLARQPVFPKFVRMVEVTDKALIAKLKHLTKVRNPFFGAFIMKESRPDGSHMTAEPTDIGEVESVGTLVQILEMTDTSEGNLRMVLEGHRRVQITGVAEIESDDEEDDDIDIDDIDEALHGDVAAEGKRPVIASVQEVPDAEYDRNNREIKALSNEIISTIRDIVNLNPLIRESMARVAEMGQRNLDNPVHLADFAANLTSAEPHELQDIMEELDVTERLSKVLELLKRELLQLKLQSKIGKEVEAKVTKLQRENLLREQLKVIKKELGITKDDSDTLDEKYGKALEGKIVPKEVKEVIDEERSKLGMLEPRSSEFNVTRAYLDWLTCLPWGVRSEESFDIDNALTILDEDHYGMKDVKDRILEFIAVGKLQGKMQGKILTFIGPPGVGKTSIARSIARALNREYYRFSLGGLHDVAEIKGHRRTYIGAMPGKIIQCLKKTHTENPLVLLDEVDKIGMGRHGDPTSALLELLDPEQNANFLDHYLDVPVDLSQVLFVCTANVYDTIPGPLLDRMEVIDLSGYMADEKVAIANRYLIPQARKETAVEESQFQISDDALHILIRNYCRESGVRNLKKKIDKVFRKGALKLVTLGDKRDDLPIVVSKDTLSEYVGQPIFQNERLYETTPPGVVMGLAWTSMGGSVLYIETVASKRVRQPVSKDAEAGVHTDTPGFGLTGSLGDVMKESAQIAYTFSKHYFDEMEPDNDFFRRADIRLHVPEGATPKDGPSAGCTIVTALMSLAMDKPVRENLAMTGELSLTGKVLRVGGIKEKVLAAKRSGVTHIILPEGNRTDWVELPESVREGVEIHFASDYKDVFKVAFPEN